jgi:hypothetical protein
MRIKKKTHAERETQTGNDRSKENREELAKEGMYIWRKDETSV